MDAPATRLEAIQQARDIASWDELPTYQEALERLATIFTMLEPWAREDPRDPDHS